MGIPLKGEVSGFANNRPGECRVTTSPSPLLPRCLEHPCQVAKRLLWEPGGRTLTAVLLLGENADHVAGVDEAHELKDTKRSG